MQEQKHIPGPSSILLVILLAAAVKFALHMYIAPGYGYFGDELYTIALSKHLAFGYVDLPPLVPALVALSRALLGESLFALHIVPALAGAVRLVFTCLIVKEFGGRTFAVSLTALGSIIVPIWLGLDSIFCYDSIDQMVLAGFLYVLVRFLRTGDRRLWILLGLIAGIACNTKMTILFLGPGFLIALLISKYRRDLFTPWPWLGAALCLILVIPYLLWQIANGWPTLEYWANYGAIRVYQASLPQYLINVLVYMNLFLLPLWLVGLYRIFSPLEGVNYSFLGLLFLLTLALMFLLHAAVRMLAELFIPLLAAGSVCLEEWFSGLRWGKIARTAVIAYLLAITVLIIPLTLPVLPADRYPAFAENFNSPYLTVKEFNGTSQGSLGSLLLSGRVGWEELVRDIAAVYDALPAEDRVVAGIYSNSYMPAGAVDLYGPEYGLPHAVSGSLTYYRWGPGYSWEVMILITDKTNNLSVFFDECELGMPAKVELFIGRPYIFVCRKPTVSADVIWSSVKSYR